MKFELELKCRDCGSSQYLVLEEYVNFGVLDIAVVCYNPECSSHGGLSELEDYINLDEIVIKDGYTGEQNVWDAESKLFHMIFKNGRVEKSEQIKR